MTKAEIAVASVVVVVTVTAVLLATVVVRVDFRDASCRFIFAIYSIGTLEHTFRMHSGCRFAVQGLYRWREGTMLEHKLQNNKIRNEKKGFSVRDVVSPSLSAMYTICVCLLFLRMHLVRTPGCHGGVRRSRRA